MNRLIGGAILTIIIGGTAYTISQADVVKHFADDTGLTQEQAEQYISGITDDDLVTFNELGADFINDGQEILKYSAGIDCVNYEYEWESNTLSCYQGKSQFKKMGNDEISLGQAYKKLGSDSASKDDISETINLIDKVNSNLELSIVDNVLDRSTIDETKKSNSYNKAILKAALESD